MRYWRKKYVKLKIENAAIKTGIFLLLLFLLLAISVQVAKAEQTEESWISWPSSSAQAPLSADRIWKGQDVWNQQQRQIDLMFTSDIHSHLEPFQTTYGGKQQSVGGLARMMTLIRQHREKNPDTLLLDGGDFSMGTVYQLLYQEEAPELRMFGYMGYDAVTLGNHEFDYKGTGLAEMLETAVDSGDTLPAFVLCNVKWSATGNDQETQLKEAFEAYGIRPYIMVEKNGVRIAITGVMGKAAKECINNCPLHFEDPVTAVKRTVAEIEEKEDPDMIICLSHSGTRKDSEKSEDERLAEQVPDLDVIVSGHSHRVLKEAIRKGNTTIVSVGEYGERIGSLSLKQRTDGSWGVTDYHLISLTDKVAEDPKTAEQLQTFSAMIDTRYLSTYGYTTDQVLAENPWEFSSSNALYDSGEENPLADLMSDAFFYTASNYSDAGEKVDVAVVPSGCVRDTIITGDVTVEDVFRTYCLGTGADGSPGYPLIGVWLTGDELSTAAEIDASVGDFMKSARLYPSGLSYVSNPKRIILNRVVSVKNEKQYTIPWRDQNDIFSQKVKRDQLYYVVTDLYTGQMFERVQKMSWGILSVRPKDKDGNLVTDLNTCILHDSSGKEIKAWEAIARYMECFPENEEGVRSVPAYYTKLHSRKIVDEDGAFLHRVQHPGRYLVIAVMLIGVVAVSVILIVVSVIKWIQRMIGKL